MRIGVDLGGTKIEAIALADDGQELARQRVATPRGNYDETVQAIAALVEWLEDKTAQVGSVALSGWLSNASTPVLVGIGRVVFDLCRDKRRTACTLTTVLRAMPCRKVFKKLVAGAGFACPP